MPLNLFVEVVEYLHFTLVQPFSRSLREHSGKFLQLLTFYTEFIPEAEALFPGVTADVMNSPYHPWTKGLSKEQLQQQLDFL